jgi:uncharacterized protein (TIGR02996 family)
MNAPLTLTEELVFRLAPNAKAAQAGLDLVKRNAFTAARRSPDGTWLNASCQGSQRKPYTVFVDLADPQHAVAGCNCDSYQRPCKHALGLLLLAVRSPEAFTAEAPPEEQRKRLRRRPGHSELVLPHEEPTAAPPAPETVGEALYQAICAEPEVDAHRLVYADWLEEQGDAARAEFIRLQCEMAQLGERDPRRAKLSERQKKLWDKHRSAWLKDAPRHLRGQLDCERGFLGELSLPVQSVVKYGEELCAHYPIHRLKINRPLSQAEASQLAVCPFLARIRALDIVSRVQRDHRTLGVLLNTPLLSALTELDVSSNELGSRGLAVLLGWAGLARLEVLDLSSNRLGAAGVKALAAAPGLGRLRRLVLYDNNIGSAGAEALAGCERLDRLEELDLMDNEVGPKGTRALANSPYLARLKVLNLNSNPIGAVGGRALAESPHLANLSRLELDGCVDDRDAAVKALLRQRFGERVGFLD